MNFLVEYLKHPFKVGAVAPSSKYLAGKMTASISFSKAECIIEYGPGTGVFTKEIIRQKQENTIFLIIEQNEIFYLNLYKKYHNLKNVYICHGDARQVSGFMKQYKISQADYDRTYFSESYRFYRKNKHTRGRSYIIDGGQWDFYSFDRCFCTLF